MRQTPGRSGRWGSFRFSVDEALKHCEAWAVFESLETRADVFCPPDRTVFITGEPSDIGRYHPEFLAQFGYVISGRNDLSHPRQIYLQPAHPWFVERDLDELLVMPPPAKSRDICVLISDKAFTEGHRRRLDFLERLRQVHPAIDIFGRGIRPFESKWDTLLPYRYTLVLENSDERDFVTEKMPDAWLAFCHPIYSGSVNAERYASPDAFTRIDIAEPEAAIARIGSLLADETGYGTCLPAVVAARQDYLTRWQFFGNLAGALEIIVGLSRKPPEMITIRPNSEFLAEEAARSQAVAPAPEASLPESATDRPSTAEAEGPRADPRGGLLSALRDALSSIGGKQR
ncbi:glycosyltransferase family 10 [Bosea sp. RAF48]|uniref:glycosyltransferase family 10 domain-containing protein n=1 Tax=Bosea sp. RAF48 TaxID=3237480 RepID=UPI003F92ED3D